jgi:dTDP-4-amino-4,6-dideoxygalactose transaminase
LRNAGLTLPFVPEWVESAWHLYVVQHPQRDALQKKLGDAGIGTLIHYPIPPHLQQAYAAGYIQGQFPIAEQVANQCLSLPIGPHLDEASTSVVIAALRAVA